MCVYYRLVFYRPVKIDRKTLKVITVYIIIYIHTGISVLRNPDLTGKIKKKTQRNLIPRTVLRYVIVAHDRLYPRIYI